MGSISITVPLTLLSLAAGIFLLAKTNRDALSLIYKIAAWFIIAASILNLGCSAIHCMMRSYGNHFKYEMMMQEKMDKKMHKHMKKDKWHEHEGTCQMGCEKEGYAKGGSMDACWKKCNEELKDTCRKKEK